MKLLAFHNRYTALNDRLFTDPNAPIGDDLLLPFNVLAVEAKKRGVICTTLQHCPERPIGVVFIDHPPEEEWSSGRAMLRSLRETGVPLYLIAFENETILPENWREHDAFSKVFSWSPSDPLIAMNHVTLNYAQRFPDTLPSAGARGFCCMVAGDKSNSDARSIYHRRWEAIRAFSSDPDFALYGPGWDGSLAWRGTIPPGQKRATIAKYRFSLAFENARFPGYVTEKLFDCMIAGTVPVYLGAQDIRNRVDPACYIDGSNFLRDDDSLDGAALLSFLRHVSEEAWLFRREAALRWMNSEAAKPYTIETFVETLLREVVP